MTQKDYRLIKEQKASKHAFKQNFHGIGIGNLAKYILFAFLFVAVLGDTGCKTAKPVVKDDTERLEREAREKALAEKKKREEEERLKKEAEEKERKEAEERERAKRAPYEKLESYFNSIAGAASPSEANNIINEAQQMFSNAGVPVLILIYKQGETKDYDKPSDISKYLNFLKDQKKNLNRIDDLQFDSNGKITEVTLIKK